MRLRRPAAPLRKRVAALSRRGPHRVLRGDLAFAGLPGAVYTPEAGLNLPGVAFGHDWLSGTASRDAEGPRLDLDRTGRSEDVEFQRPGAFPRLGYGHAAHRQQSQT